MKNINNDNKLHELGLYVNMNLNSINISKQQNVNIDNSKNDNNSSNTITRIKRKASTMNYKQRELQERISNIQTQETKIYEMEKALESAKYSYSEKLKNEKKEFLKVKVKINQLSKQEDDLELKSNADLKNKTRDKQHEDERVISIIEETLKKIEQIKNQISIYKSKLMDLEDSVDKAISKLSSSKDFIDKDFVIEELGFISIEDNVETGIIININI